MKTGNKTMKTRKKTTKTRKKRMKTRNKILIIVSIFLLVFIIAMIIIFCVKGTVPDTLIEKVLGVSGVVDVMTAAITVADMVLERKKSGENP